MRNLLTDFLRLIFPTRPTETILEELDVSTIELKFSPGCHESIFYLSSYQDEVIKSAIVENKFYRNKKATVILATLLQKWNKHQIANTLYLPIPLSDKRKRERGYNQVEIILEQLKSELEFNTKILKRTKHTQPQTQLQKESRLINLKGAFVYKEKVDLNAYQQVVIFDDVSTTGGTLNEARATLAPHLPPNTKIICLALAH